MTWNLKRAIGLLLTAAIIGTAGGESRPAHAGESKGSGKDANISLQNIWRTKTGDFAEGAAEIVAYDKGTGRLFVVNFQASTVDVLAVVTGTSIAKIDLSDLGSPNSVSVNDGLVAVAVEAPTKTDPGAVVFYDAHKLKRLKVVGVGSQPDMLTFTANGKKVVVANEGEPNDEYTVDPEGSVSIIDVSRGVDRASVATASFRSFNNRKAALRASGVRIFGPESTIDEPDDTATVAQDLEPEYITIDGDTAYVTLQEANAIAVVDLGSAKVTSINPLGVKNHNVRGNELDASDRDKSINIAKWPVKGMYLPDTIASYRVGGQTYLVTANEGDTRAWTGFNEEARVGGLTLDPKKFPTAEELKKPENLGRLKVTSTLGGETVTDAEGNETTVYRELYSFGTRSFSIWTERNDGRIVQVFDSGSDFERITAELIPQGFNSDHESNDSFDTRSDDKGPEPEALTLGKLDGRTYAFIGLERVGGIMIYDVTDPEAPRFVNYSISRDFTKPLDEGNHSDTGPEGIIFIPADDNPLHVPLVVTANEITSTVTVARVKQGNRRDAIDILFDLLGDFMRDWLAGYLPH